MDSIYHDCNGSRESATNPDDKVSFSFDIGTNNSSSREVEGAIIIQALQHIVVDVVAQSSCAGSIVSSIFHPSVSVHGSCSQEEEATCTTYQGSIIVRYHLAITDPTLQSLQAVVQHNEVIRTSRQAISDSLDDIQQYVNGVLLADDSTTTTRVTNMSFSADEEEATIDIFDETSSSNTEGTGAIAIPPTPAPTRQSGIVVAATENESAIKENDPNMSLLFGSIAGILALFLLCCCCCFARRRRRRQNTIKKAPTVDEFEKSNHTEDEASLHEQQQQQQQQLERQPRPSSVLDGSRNSASSSLDVYRCHSVTCNSCATCGYKAKKKFPWGSPSLRKSSLLIGKNRSKSRHASVELMASDNGIFEQEDIAALERMQQVDQKLFGKNGQDDSAGVEFISAVGKSAVKMGVLHDLVLQETRRQHHYNKQEHQDKHSGSEDEESLV